MQKLLITCEHASCRIPRAYQKLFKHDRAILKTHEGWDIGALTAYHAFVDAFPQAYHQHADWSRLLIDLNRSLEHPRVLSKFTKTLNNADKESIIKTYYQPYRDKLISQVDNYLKKQHQVIHIAIHSFTPVMNGKKRIADIGFLYDPAQKEEQRFAKIWRQACKLEISNFSFRMNYPYWGKTDGLCTAMRQRCSSRQYIGIELEINQVLFEKGNKSNLAINLLIKALLALVHRFEKF